MVIQRLQNLYLLLAAIVMAAFAFTVSSTVLTEKIMYSFSCIKMTVTPENTVAYLPVSIALVVVSVALMLIAIGKFKDLKAQKKTVGVGILMSVALTVYVYFNAYVQYGHIGGDFQVSFAAALPVASILLQIMARKGIKQDIKLLSDSDRIR